MCKRLQPKGTNIAAWLTGNVAGESKVRVRHLLVCGFALAAVNATSATQVSIDFEGTGAPVLFINTTPLGSLYASLGVTFSGVNGPGVSILNQLGGFGFPAHSGTDFLGYNNTTGLPPTGSIFDLNFSQSVTAVSIWAASDMGQSTPGASFLMEGIDANNVVVSFSNLSGMPYWQQMAVAGTGITKVRITASPGTAGAFDDLVFQPATPIPEPATIFLWLTGLGSLSVAAAAKRFRG